MANCTKLFIEFNGELSILPSKKDRMISSRENLRRTIREDFEENHPGYKPEFYVQGSYKLGTAIRTKSDHCDLDDGVYFKSNPDDVSGKTLQKWILKAVEETTNADPTHKNKCIRVTYSAGYDIDLPVMIFDKEHDSHPLLAVRDSEFQEDDPKEFTDYYKANKSSQMNRIVKYLKAWCDHKSANMPSGLAMTIFSLDNFYENDRDDIALKNTLVEIENQLNEKFECIMPTTPNDNLFANYSDTKKNDFLNNLSSFIKDAKKALEEKNQLKASKLWQKHLGERFPNGKNEDEDDDKSKSKLKSIIGTSRPYCKIR